jgi:hypothetical protein
MTVENTMKILPAIICTKCALYCARNVHLEILSGSIGVVVYEVLIERFRFDFITTRCVSYIRLTNEMRFMYSINQSDAFHIFD